MICLSFVISLSKCEVTVGTIYNAIKIISNKTLHQICYTLDSKYYSFTAMYNVDELKKKLMFDATIRTALLFI